MKNNYFEDLICTKMEVRGSKSWEIIFMENIREITMKWK